MQQVHDFSDIQAPTPSYEAVAAEYEQIRAGLEGADWQRAFER